MTVKTRDAKAHKLVIKCRSNINSMPVEISRLRQSAKRFNYLSDHVVKFHCYEEWGLSKYCKTERKRYALRKSKYGRI